ncbi:hypothetical protein NDU88_001786 [Pleurodeles waltl]|uniref:Uncharacterized protein n=1 Tax=Pleurodeles waltl TaxID=8319 RepID=A0AAV7T1H8_PLEWA|nr:hypothetical protein NDU88_001786 [Pleurodeles waltl]
MATPLRCEGVVVWPRVTWEQCIKITVRPIEWQTLQPDPDVNESVHYVAETSGPHGLNETCVPCFIASVECGAEQLARHYTPP